MLKIYELYPLRLAASSVYDENNNKWGAALFLIENQSLGDTIFSLDGYYHDTEQTAIMELDRILNYTIESIKIMAN